MSSSRANASARSRRAGGNDPMPNQIKVAPNQQGRQTQSAQQYYSQQNSQQIYSQQNAQQFPQKITIPGAISIITQRMGNLEQTVRELQLKSGFGTTLDETSPGKQARPANDFIFSEILNRIELLEKRQSAVSNKEHTSNVTSSASASAVSDSSEVFVKIEVLMAEIAQIKDHMLNLQSFTMQTNQRLSDIVFQEDDAENDNLEITNEPGENAEIVSGDVTDVQKTLKFSFDEIGMEELTSN